MQKLKDILTNSGAPGMKLDPVLRRQLLDETLQILSVTPISAFAETSLELADDVGNLLLDIVVDKSWDAARRLAILKMAETLTESSENKYVQILIGYRLRRALLRAALDRRFLSTSVIPSLCIGMWNIRRGVFESVSIRREFVNILKGVAQYVEGGGVTRDQKWAVCDENKFVMALRHVLKVRPFHVSEHEMIVSMLEDIIAALCRIDMRLAVRHGLQCYLSLLHRGSTAIRKQCAAMLPFVTETFHRTASHDLRQAFRTLSSDRDRTVRLSTATAFVEVARLLVTRRSDRSLCLILCCMLQDREEEIVATISKSFSAIVVDVLRVRDNKAWMMDDVVVAAEHVRDHGPEEIAEDMRRQLCKVREMLQRNIP